MILTGLHNYLDITFFHLYKYFCSSQFFYIINYVNSEFENFKNKFLQNAFDY